MRDTKFAPLAPIAGIGAMAVVTLAGWFYIAMPSQAQLAALCPGARSRPDVTGLPMDRYCGCWVSETHGFTNHVYRLMQSTEGREAIDRANRQTCQIAVTRTP